MASDVMAVRLHLRQIRVLEVLEDAPDVLRVSVESTFRRLRCAQCGFKCHRVHDRRDKKIRDLGVSGRPTTLVWSASRARRRSWVGAPSAIRSACDNCGSRFLEDHPAFGGALTARLARRLAALGRFCDLYETGELPEFHDIVDTFIAWSDEILAWHHSDRASNGRIEGTNLLQVLRRSAHRLRRCR